jgi:ABC-type iron transport system FetAB permease component
MAGMILAGADRLQAVRLQVVAVFMLLAAVSLTATLFSQPPATRHPVRYGIRHE